MPATYHGIYIKYSENVARSATPAVQTGTANTAYPAANLIDGNPALVCKVDSTTGAVILEYASKQPAKLFAAIHQCVDGALSGVRIQGNDTNSWGSPSFDAPVVIPAVRGAGVTRWPVNPWVDLSLASGYDAAGWKFYRYYVPGNSQNLQIGQLVLASDYHKFDPNVDWGPVEEDSRLNIVQRTAFNVKHTTRRGTVQWRRSAQIEDCPDTLRDALKAHVDDVDGDTFPWLLVPDGTVNDCRFVKYAEPKSSIVYRLTNSSTVSLVVEEVSRGLRPGT